MELQPMHAQRRESSFSAHAGPSSSRGLAQGTNRPQPVHHKSAQLSARQAAPLRAATLEAPQTSEKGTLTELSWFEGKKRLQVQVADLADDTKTIRCLDWDRDRFDIEFGLEKGTTYNSHLIMGDQIALVDTSHEKFRDTYLPVLKNLLGSASPSYLFASHLEPDHAGLIGDLLNMYPDLTVVASKVGLMYLKGFIHRPFKQQAVKGGDVIDLGKGHRLEFNTTPNLHWPDTMFSFDHGTGVMFTCDAFGMHYCAEEVFDTQLDALSNHYRFYYDCLMRPNSRSVLTALRKVKDLPYTTIANGHGPLLRHNVPELVGRYKTWSDAVGKSDTSVAVLYCDNYGYCDRLSQTLARGITKAGVATEMVDLLSVDPQELTEIMGRSNGVVLMTPPRESKEAQSSLATMVSALKSKHKVLVAESYGGQDEPVDTLIGSCVDAGADTSLEPLRVRDTPSENTYQGYEEAGTDIAQLLTKKDTITKQKAAMSPDIAKALAKLANGLYVVTAAHSDKVKGAMVASWVSQASFEPLGLTVAVAKDRAIESLLQVGDVFCLNCLGEGNSAPIMKHFLQRFPPGADRFAGVKTFASPSNGIPALSEAIAFSECRVVSRMETPDHFITYAEVIAGGVAQPDQKTAVHRRKVASYY